MSFDLLEVGHECALSMTDSYRLWGLILRVCSQEGPAWWLLSRLKASVRGYRAPTVRQQVRLLRLGPVRTHTQMNNAVVVFFKDIVFGIQKTVQLGVRESVRVRRDPFGQDFWFRKWRHRVGLMVGSTRCSGLSVEAWALIQSCEDDAWSSLGSFPLLDHQGPLLIYLLA